jgi:hypothetical protein
MPLYVYAIADALIAVDDLRGVAGEPLRVVTSGDGKAHAIAGDLAAAGDRLAAPPPPPTLTAETLRAQDALVRELAARVDALLPARFGSRFADEMSLRQALDDLAIRLDRALTHVRGREQMTIRLFHEGSTSAPAGATDASNTSDAGKTSDAGNASGVSNTSDASSASDASNARDDGPIGPGTRYMRQRAAEGRHLPAAAEELRAALADAIDDERVERGQSPVIGSIHHLIPRGSAERYRARLDEAATSPRFAASGIRLRVSGPSPAYAFAEADLT